MAISINFIFDLYRYSSINKHVYYNFILFINNLTNSTPHIIMAAKKQSLEIVKLLVEHGANLKVKEVHHHFVMISHMRFIIFNCL